MEKVLALLVLAVVVLFFMMFTLQARISTLAKEFEIVRQNLGDQGAELNRLLEPVPVGPAAVPLGEIVLAESTLVREDPTLPHLDRALEPVRDLVNEALPGMAVASAAVGVAQRKRAARRKQKQPTRFQRWLQYLRAQDEWEVLIGGRLLNRIGAIAIILGMAFFFKYAVDQNWVRQGARVAVGVLAGAGLLGLAARSHRAGYAIFAQGLVGAGQAVLYLAVYASFNFYHLIPQPMALVAMFVISALGLAQAIYYDSLAVSLLACLGGYLTPFLLSSGQSSPAGVITYIFVLDVGVLVVLARQRGWIVLEPIALLATYVTYLSWYLGSYHKDLMVLAATAITLFWGLFLLFDLYSNLRSPASIERIRQPLGIVNGLAYYLGLLALVLPDHRGWMSALTLAIGAIYLASLLVMKRRGHLPTLLAARYTLTAMILLVLATAIGARGFWIVILWAVEAMPLVWYGTRWKLWYVWRPALVLFALATGLLFATQSALAYGSVNQFLPLVNLRALAFLILAGSFALSTIPLGRLAGEKSKEITTSLHYGWMALVFILLAVETNDLFRRLMVGASVQSSQALQFERSLTVAALWMVFSLPLGWFAWRKRIVPWLIGGLASAALAVGLGAVVGIAFEPIQRFTPVANVRVALFLCLISGLLVHLRWLAPSSQLYAWITQVRTVVQIVILVLGFELVSAEINDYFLRRVGHPLPSMDTGGAFIELAILATIWMLYSLLPTWYGVRKGTAPLITLGLSMGAAATGVAAFAGIVFQPSTQFALMLGVRPIILVLLVAGLLIQLRWLRDSPIAGAWIGPTLVALQAAIILLGFGLISAETRDAFSQRISGAGGSAQSLRDLERLAFSLVWLSYAILIMGLGIWRRARWMRLGAMALFAGIILKVFIYDLSFLGSVYRPVSFAGLGIILLAVSYLYQRYRTLLLEPR